MEDLIGFALFLLECAMWYYAFKALGALWDAYWVFREAKEVEVDLREKLTKLVHNVKPEKHADVHYWFDEETDRFLAQGRDLDEIRSHLRGRFTQDVFLVDGKILLAGPEYAPMDISKHSANDVGKYIADNLLPKLLPK
jgi:hypothetical protein